MSKHTDKKKIKYPSIYSFRQFLRKSVPSCFLQLSTAISKSSLAACDPSSHGIPVQCETAWSYGWDVVSVMLPHTGLRICWWPLLYLKETCTLASYPSHCNYCHLSSVCMIYSQLKLAQKGSLLCVHRVINVTLLWLWESWDLKLCTTDREAPLHIVAQVRGSHLKKIEWRKKKTNPKTFKPWIWSSIPWSYTYCDMKVRTDETWNLCICV